MVASDIDLKTVVTEDKMDNKDSRKAMKREVRKLFIEKYTNPNKTDKSNHVSFFFRKLRF